MFPVKVELVELDPGSNVYMQIEYVEKKKYIFFLAIAWLKAALHQP